MPAVMTTTERIFRKTCLRCDRPALTFDDQDRPLCSRHATIFLTAERVIAANDEWWESVDSEAKSSPQQG